MGSGGWSERKETWIYAVSEEDDVEEAEAGGQRRGRWGERVAFVCWALLLLLLLPFLAACPYLRKKRLLNRRRQAAIRQSNQTASLQILMQSETERRCNFKETLARSRVHAHVSSLTKAVSGATVPEPGALPDAGEDSGGIM